jgi:signal transduction histidine kinase/AraC-like DNA-binding protein/DNA-binding LytR/AlgR family response regulator
MVLAMLNHETVSDRVILPTRLLVRQSCGCPDPIIVQAASELPAAPDAPGRTLEATLAAQRPVILADMLQALNASPAGNGATAVAQLLSAFTSELTGAAPGSFLFILDKSLRQAVAAGEMVSGWHEVISGLRRQGLACLTEPAVLRRAEHIWQQARVMIGETAQRAQGFQTWQVETQAKIIGDINQALSIVLDVDELTSVLAEALPRLNIHLCFLSLYENPAAPATSARLVLAQDRRGRLALPRGGLRFPSRQLVPEGSLPREQCSSWVVEPLFFRTDQLGFVLFEANPRQEEIYEILSGQISAALKRTLLAEHNVQLYQEAVQARQVAEEGRRLAEEADCLKSRFLATVSHELRTPLTLIVGMIDMILSEEAGGKISRPGSYQHDLMSIRSSAQHLARLIGDVLDLASSQAGELRLACEPLNLEPFLQETILLSEPLVREKGLAWSVELPPALPLIWADRTRLKQVILNLISNATKFTEKGEVALTVTCTDHEVTIAVRDTGMGIPQAEQEIIFNEFQQSERTTQRGYGGMGLGLAISRRLIELHGGQIGMRSSGEDGAGSTFYFTLPLMATTALPAPGREDLSHRVLLLTGRAGGEAKLQAHLTRRGFDVTALSFENHPDWLNQITATSPGAVVLDLQPAEERGWELIKRLKQNPATQDTPVVFYTLSETQDRGAMLALDYLVKPARGSDLTRALDRHGLSKAGTSQPTILIVDDDSCILDLHARVVTGHVPGSRVLKARNGREALGLMEQTVPDLLLLDLMMPEVDGFGVLEGMRQHERLRGVPVIVLTAQILTGPDMARLQQGVVAVLGKGLFSSDEVLAQVEATLARNKRLGSEAQRAVRQVMAYIHEHYAEPLTRAELAQHVGLSERHLNRCFHDEMGMPTKTYLNRYRVRQAKRLLADHHQSVVEVALAVGFSSSTYFGRVFREETGLSPSAYRHDARLPEA